jgi:hypothetical protein
LNLVKDNFEDRLTDDAFGDVKKGVEGISSAADALRAVKLENGDEPFTRFVPYKEETS